jgi:uncharacterized protein HemX
MSSDLLGFTLVLVAVLLGLAGYFGWQQVRTLRGLKAPAGVDADNRFYLRSQAYRRLFCSLLMVVLAAQLVGWLFLEATDQELQRELRAARAIDPAAPPSQEQKAFAQIFVLHMSAGLFVLLMLLVLATMDFWATARYGLSQHRKLQADHRALLKKEVDKHRQERNGQQKG